jgi:hypothetical protein
LNLATFFDSYNKQPDYHRIGDSVTLTLVKGGVITGTVTTSTGDPVVGIGVSAMMIRDADNRSPKTARLQFGERFTDDRGVYRLYGLPAGTYVISTSTRSFYSGGNTFELDSPTYAPSSTRDTAGEVVVVSGQETTGVDIRYRGEPGHTISGTVSGLTQLVTSSTFNTTISLRQLRNGILEGNNATFVPSGSSGFALNGIADGEYTLQALSAIEAGAVQVSEPVNVSVKGADVTGLVLVPKPLATISGRVVLEPSTVTECKNKRRPLFEEMLVQAVRVKASSSNGPLQLPFFADYGQSGSTNKAGEFVLRNVSPGRYGLSSKFFAKYWYLKRIALTTPTVIGRAPTQANDLGRTGITVKHGDKLNNVLVTLAEGAASLRGRLKLSEGQKVSRRVVVFLAPADRDAADDPFHYSASPVDVDGSFVFSNVQSGSYYLVTDDGSDESIDARNIRDVDRNEQRLKLRRKAEGTKTVITLKPCQNITDYELSTNPN